MQTYRRAAQIREQFAALAEANVFRAYDYVSVLLSLAAQIRNAGDRQGALETYRRAKAALEKFDASKMPNANQRRILASGYCDLSNQLASMNEDASALDTARIAVQLSDALYKADPKLSSHVEQLIAARKALALALDHTGDYRGAAEEYRGAMEMRSAMAPSTALQGPLIDVAQIQRNIAGLEARQGDRLSAERDFHRAIEINLKVLMGAEKLWSADRKNNSPLLGLFGSEQRIAEILERLGQPAEALGHWSKALEYASLLFDADPKNLRYINALRNATHAVERFEWEKSGERGNYRRVAGPELMESTATSAILVPLTLAGVRADVARAYLNVGEVLEDDGDLERTRAAAFKALDMYVALLRDVPLEVSKDAANSKRGIVSSLECLADGNMLMARRTSGQERRGNLQEARDYLARANTVIRDVEAMHQLSAGYINTPGRIAVKLATAEDWLHGPEQITQDR